MSIGRWVTKGKATYGRYHPTFADFEDVLDWMPTTHAEKLAWLRTLNFQELGRVSFNPAREGSRP